jgi:glycogen synthase
MLKAIYKISSCKVNTLLLLKIAVFRYTITITQLQTYMTSHASKKGPPTVLEQKQHQKLALQAACNWPKETKVPLICLPLGMTDALGGKLLEEILPGIMELSNELLILGKGSAEYGTLFTKLAKEHPHRVHIVQNTPEHVSQMLTASDMALFFAEPTEEELKVCLSFGVVPISPASKAIEDYNPVQESGTAFVYDKLNVWQCFAALARATETFKFPYDWRTIQRHCIEQ